jgi:hypothetical protein
VNNTRSSYRHCSRNWKSNLLKLAVLPFLLIITNSASGIDTQFNFSPYYDSNIIESLANPVSGYGFKLRAKTSEDFTAGQFQFRTGILAQGYLETEIYEESKIILVPQISVSHPISSNSVLFLRNEGFYKRFPDKHSVDLNIQGDESTSSQKRYRYWVDGQLGVRTRIDDNLQSSVSFRYRPTTVENLRTYQYETFLTQWSTKLYLGSHFNLSTGLGYVHIQHRDFLARKLNSNGSLVRSDHPQRDYGLRLETELQYRGAIIAGVRLLGESIRSNSVVGKYVQARIEPYLSGYIGSKFFYHFAFEFSYKEYEHENQQIIIGYRDPEGPAQNRAHMKIERFIGDDLLSFIQVSLFRNESIIVGRYYDKTIAQIGLEYTW